MEVQEIAFLHMDVNSVLEMISFTKKTAEIIFELRTSFCATMLVAMAGNCRIINPNFLTCSVLMVVVLQRFPH